MHHYGLTATHIEVLRQVYSGERTVSQVADQVGKSIAWTSECITRLESMGLVEKRKDGLSVTLAPAEGELARCLSVLLVEDTMLHLSKVMSKAALAILPSLVGNGASVRELELRTGLSSLTIRKCIREWRSMGIVRKQNRSARYRLDTDRRALAEFIIQYSGWRNLHRLQEVVPEAVIVWERGDEFLFSSDGLVHRPGFLAAGPTRLDELDLDLVHTREYYLHDALTDQVSVEEALVQSLLVDPKNPRIAGLVRDGIEHHGMDPLSLQGFGAKYGIPSILERVVTQHGA